MATLDSLSLNDIYIIATGILMGTLARISTLKVDFRQIPTYPSAYFNNIVFGFIASALGMTVLRVRRRMSMSEGRAQQQKRASLKLTNTAPGTGGGVCIVCCVSLPAFVYSTAASSALNGAGFLPALPFFWNAKLFRSQKTPSE